MYVFDRTYYVQRSKCHLKIQDFLANSFSRLGSADQVGKLVKIPTRLAYKALSLNFAANSYLSKTPVEFDRKKRRFKYTKITRENVSRYAPWLSSIFFFFYFISIGCAWYVILRQIVKPNPNVKVKHIFSYAMMNTSGILVIGTTVYILKSGREAILRVNWLVQRYEEMFPEEGKFSCSTP